jgi:hypothetical protein
MICTGISSTVDPSFTRNVVGFVKRKALIRVSLVEDCCVFYVSHIRMQLFKDLIPLLMVQKP